MNDTHIPIIWRWTRINQQRLRRPEVRTRQPGSNASPKQRQIHLTYQPPFCKRKHMKSSWGKRIYYQLSVDPSGDRRIYPLIWKRELSVDRHGECRAIRSKGTWQGRWSPRRLPRRSAIKSTTKTSYTHSRVAWNASRGSRTAGLHPWWWSVSPLLSFLKQYDAAKITPTPNSRPMRTTETIPYSSVWLTSSDIISCTVLRRKSAFIGTQREIEAVR